MDELRTLFARMGLTGVATFIASGNVIFAADDPDAAALQEQIESELQQALGYAVATFLRTDAEVAAIARHQPFPAPVLAAAGALNVAILAEPLSAAEAQLLMTLKTAIDDFHVHGREVYWLCQAKQSESTFSNTRFERTLRKQTTLRGINTVRKLAAQYAP